MHGLRQRHQRLARVRPGVEVHQRVLVHSGRHPGPIGHDALDAPVGEVVDVVELRHVDAAGSSQPQQQAVSAIRATLVLPLAHDLADCQHHLLTVAQHSGVDEVGDRLRVEGGVTAGDHDRRVVTPVGGVQRDAGEVEGGQHVRVAQLGGERDPQQVERADRSVRVDGELWDLVFAHHLLHVGEHGIGALGEDPVALVQDLVEDLHALVGQPHLVRVGVHQRPPHRDRVPVLDRRVELATDVLDRLLHRRQQRLQLSED